jgi:transposase
MQTLHRARDRLVGERTALINQLRAVLLERGIVVPQGRRKLEQHLAAMLDEGEGLPLSPRVRALVADMRAEWRELDRRIGAFDDEFAARARSDEAARRLATIPGMGVLNATALLAAIGTGEAFRRGRDLAAWLGLVPRQASTGGRAKLLGISKRGNKYLRKLLIHGARSVLRPLSRSATPLGAWAAGPPGTGAREHGGGRLGQQAGTDRLGGAVPNSDVQRGRRDGRLRNRPPREPDARG